jgi:DNA-binding response OmpR family regulator
VKARLLLVEDEPDMALIARAAFVRAGFDVRTAADGAEALVLASDGTDLIVLDWMLPGLSGVETCSRLKNNPATAHIPVVFLTGKTDEASQATCIEVGAIGCITKPFNPLSLGDQVIQLWRPSGQRLQDAKRRE